MTATNIYRMGGLIESIPCEGAVVLGSWNDVDRSVFVSLYQNQEFSYLTHSIKAILGYINYVIALPKAAFLPRWLMMRSLAWLALV